MAGGAAEGDAGRAAVIVAVSLGGAADSTATVGDQADALAGGVAIVADADEYGDALALTSPVPVAAWPQPATTTAAIATKT